jgi:hypothetical protein
MLASLQVFDVLKALDIGGSISIHAFGAYYGLAASMALPKPAAFGHAKNSASYSSDISAMVRSLHTSCMPLLLQIHMFALRLCWTVTPDGGATCGMSSSTCPQLHAGLIRACSRA